jgi:hypothetical protein
VLRAESLDRVGAAHDVSAGGFGLCLTDGVEGLGIGQDVECFFEAGEVVQLSGPGLVQDAIMAADPVTETRRSAALMLPSTRAWSPRIESSSAAAFSSSVG